MTNIPHLISANAALWKTCEILPNRHAEVMAVAQRLCLIATPKSRYKEIETRTKVPWWIVAVIHEREADQDFSCSIAQGDSWRIVSQHVPRGRGPFASFEDAAVDALAKCPPFAARWPDKVRNFYGISPGLIPRDAPEPWSPGAALTLLELYNGTGYEDFHHENSPYNWGATNHEERGKYTADGKYSAAAWDQQIGCAAMLLAMAEIDGEVKTALAA